ncbi:GNAT family N-acetyltransferase [Roseateles flavus]|uniref:GNAT family N-acetyltransferase n=1 Tax=Roseateles flavus TaxID=3149041 RepID=A0ABV0GEY8_9BURK
MAAIKRSSLRKRLHTGLRALFGGLPRDWRFAVYRRMVDCDPQPDARLQLKIAETQEELEACFRILHDAYVAAGFMKPDPSGMRITIYHALPTTTTICAKWEGRVVGTISMIREGVFGFPLQSVFDLAGVRRKRGNIAEISALAVHPDFRKTGGAVLFPLMKFMHQYCTEYFDTRHLVIAVNPDKIELYEALLFFERLQARTVDAYDFANGAPAVGATLDLSQSEALFRAVYQFRPLRKNLHHFFYRQSLDNIILPSRRYFTTNDPVLTPALLDHFFNRLSPVLQGLDDRKKALLWSIYNTPEYRQVLPMLAGQALEHHPLRQHQRYSIRCPAEMRLVSATGERVCVLDIIEISAAGFQARCGNDLALEVTGDVVVDLGEHERARLRAQVVRKREGEQGRFFGFKLVEEPDAPWRNCVAAFETGQTHRDL